MNAETSDILFGKLGEFCEADAAAADYFQK